MEGAGTEIEKKKSKNCFLSLALESKAQMEIKSITAWFFINGWNVW